MASISLDARDGFLEAPTRATVLDLERIFRRIVSLLRKGGTMLLVLVLVLLIDANAVSVQV